jgi:hypothetical protein
LNIYAFVKKVFLTYHWIFNIINTSGASNGAELGYPSLTELIPVFSPFILLNI